MLVVNAEKEIIGFLNRKSLEGARFLEVSAGLDHHSFSSNLNMTAPVISSVRLPIEHLVRNLVLSSENMSRRWLSVAQIQNTSQNRKSALAMSLFRLIGLANPILDEIEPDDCYFFANGNGTVTLRASYSAAVATTAEAEHTLFDMSDFTPVSAASSGAGAVALAVSNAKTARTWYDDFVSTVTVPDVLSYRDWQSKQSAAMRV